MFSYLFVAIEHSFFYGNTRVYIYDMDGENFVNHVGQVERKICTLNKPFKMDRRRKSSGENNSIVLV